MQRQRGELVPIGDALADLGGPVKAIRDASPQALHHFTQADQVNQLVRASEADPDLGFMGRTNPGNQYQLPAQPVNATPVLSRSARTRQPQSRKVVPGSRVQPRNSL